jgi:peptidoglycan/LPS O-acetylase OafA/YrhL
LSNICLPGPAFGLAKAARFLHRGDCKVNPPASRASPDPKASAQRKPALDGLRGIAIAMVLWHHFVEQHLPPGRGSWLGWLRAATGLSWSGVDLFFALSGFLIGGILIDNRSSPRLARVFYLRRAARILPLYYATLVVTAAAVAARLPGSYHLFPAWVYPLFLTNFAVGWAGSWDWLPLSVLWSLAVEEQFYLAAPWVVRAVPPARLPQLLAGLVALAEAGRLAVWLCGGAARHLPFVLAPLRMDALALGFLAAWAVRSPGAAPFLRSLGAHWRACLLAGAGLFVGLALLRPPEGSMNLALFGYLLIAAVMALVLLVAAAFRPPQLARLLEFGPLAALGRHSYFVYLWHPLIGGTIIALLGGGGFVLDSWTGAGLVALAVAATWAAAVLSWKWFEAPIIARAHRTAY